MVKRIVYLGKIIVQFIHIYSLITLLLFSFEAVAQAQVDDQNVMNVSCAATPEIDELLPIPNFENSNNLRRKTGSATFVEGQPIIIKGRVLDEKCVPVSGAVVNIWQANADGIYAFDAEQFGNDKPFGTGTAITDNLGNYSFISIIPGGYKRKAPHINFQVKHADFQILFTQMFFPDHPLNHDDPTFTKFAETNQDVLLTAKKTDNNNEEEGEFITYLYDITLQGQNKYITY